MAMNANRQVRIEIEAAKALTLWKAQFDEEVCQRAKILAAQTAHPELVTLAQFRQAAQAAIQSLSAAIHSEVTPDGQQEAA
jgi:hypothetical protein